MDDQIQILRQSRAWTARNLRQYCSGGAIAGIWLCRSVDEEHNEMKLHRTHTRLLNTLLLQASAALLAAISITACSRQEAPTAVAPAETLAPATQSKGVNAARSAPTGTPSSSAASESERTVIKQRSKKKSALIIGASAGTGAAVGALAGGKKGAGIGAIAGGIGGLVYDRTTAKKSVPSN
jgi:hypothetical protein